MEKLQTCAKRKTPFIFTLKELLKGKTEAGEALRIRPGKCLMNGMCGRERVLFCRSAWPERNSSTANLPAVLWHRCKSQQYEIISYAAPIQKLPMNNFQFGIWKFPGSPEHTGIMGTRACSHQLVPVQCGSLGSVGSDQSVLSEPEPRTGICSALGAAPLRAPPYWPHLELGSKPALASVAMPEVAKMKEEKSERCWGLQGWPPPHLD